MSSGMLEQPVVDKSSALDLIFGFLQIAQRRGAFSFAESAKIYECFQQFNDFFVHEEPPSEETSISEEHSENNETNRKLDVDTLGNFDEEVDDDDE